MNTPFDYNPYQLPSNNGSNDMQKQMPMSMSVPMTTQSMSMHPNFSYPIDEAAFGLTQALTQPNAVPSDASLTRSSSQANVIQNDASSSSGSSVPSFIAERTPLGPDFVPGPYDVICARGAAAANHPGNLRFRKTIKDFVPQYSKATTKLEKSLLVTAIVDSVRDHTPDGGFVKKFEDGQWYEVGDACAREKIGQTLRDALHMKYKSSTKAKKPRRKELKELKKQKQTKQAKVPSSNKGLKLPKTETQPMPSLLMSLPTATPQMMMNTPMPPLCKEQQDDGEISLTNIFYNAYVDEGLNLDTILRC